MYHSQSTYDNPSPNSSPYARRASRQPSLYPQPLVPYQQYDQNGAHYLPHLGQHATPANPSGPPSPQPRRESLPQGGNPVQNGGHSGHPLRTHVQGVYHPPPGAQSAPLPSNTRRRSLFQASRPPTTNTVPTTTTPPTANTPLPTPPPSRYTSYDGFIASEASHQEPDSKLLKATDALATVQNTYDKVTQNISQFEKIPGASALMQPLKPILTALETIANVHPITQVAVFAFKAIVSFEMQRRDNDEKVSGLLLIIGDTLYVMKDLAQVRDKQRLETCLKKISDHIQDCGNFIDTYRKQKGMMKLLKSFSIGEKLKHYTTVFAGNKEELRYCMQIQVVMGVSSANVKIETVDVKIDKVIAMMQYKSEKQRKMEEFLEANGGMNRVVNDNALLQQLAGQLGERFDATIQRALKVDFEAALAENRILYTKRMADQTRQIKQEMQLHTDRILARFDAGPHERIMDPDMKALWKSMEWKNNVKGRHFIAALYDYFDEKFARGAVEGNPCVDAWTIQYMGIRHGSDILDAIDWDGSLYVAIDEVNKFTTEKPEGWTLAEWIAYSGRGAEINQGKFAFKVEDIMDKMKRLQKRVQGTAAAVRVDQYMNKGLKVMEALASGVFVPVAEGPNRLTELCDTYAKDVQSAIYNTLVEVNYTLSDSSDVNTVLASLRPDLFLPLLLSLLYRHYRILLAHTKRAVSAAEFDAMIATLNAVRSSAHERLTYLRNVWRNMRVKPEEALSYYFGGIYDDLYDEEEDSDFEENEYTKAINEDTSWLEVRRLIHKGRADEREDDDDDTFIDDSNVAISIRYDSDGDYGVEDEDEVNKEGQEYVDEDEGDLKPPPMNEELAGILYYMKELMVREEEKRDAKLGDMIREIVREEIRKSSNTCI